MACTRTDIDHDNSLTRIGRKAQDLAEVAIKRDQYPPFPDRHFKNLLVWCPEQVLILIPNCHHFMARQTKEFGDASAQVFVQLDFHSAGTGTNCSRAASAP